MANHTDGDLNKILRDLDIYESNLKNWTDLQEYVNVKTGGKIGPGDLNRIAAAVLAETDPSIESMKKKILAFSENSASGKANLWILWVLIGAGLFSLFLIIWKRKRNNKK
jgi:hypothetical protein